MFLYFNETSYDFKYGDYVAINNYLFPLTGIHSMVQI